MFHFAQFATGRIRRGGHYRATYWRNRREPVRSIPLIPVLLEQSAFDKLRNNRSNRDLHIPLLAKYPGMHRHVLHRELNFDGQTPQFHHLAQAEPDGDRPHVRGRRVPVCQDITQSSNLRRRRSSRWVAGSSGWCQGDCAAHRWTTIAGETRR